MSTSWLLLKKPSCFFDLLSAALHEPRFHRRSAYVAACMCPWEREISRPRLYGKTALALFFCTLCSECLLFAVFT